MVDLKLNFPEDFFDEEVLDGYKVDTEMKKVWAVELDLLYVLIQVLEEHKLTYFAMGGTLLGAVRHQGYIPWDNDIDIIMPREDYNKLLALGNSVFEEPYFLSSPYTEKGYWRSHLQLRNSLTTGIIKEDINRDHNRGIFIDIFVLDEVPDKYTHRKFHTTYLKVINKIGLVAMDSGLPYGKKNTVLIKLITPIAKGIVSLVGFEGLYRYYNKVCARFNGKGYSSLAHTTLVFHEGKVWKKKDFDEKCDLKFHHLSLCCPIGYDAVLRKQYGDDYMDIPTEHPDTTHGEIYFDTERDYKKFITEELL